jgi:spermidine synthase
MMDLESMMRASMEPIRVRKRPGFWLRLLSWIWPITVERRQGDLGASIRVVAWRGKYMMDTAKVNYSFGSLHEVMKGSIGAMVAKGVKTDRVLMLGYGGGSAAEIIHQDYNRESEIVGVESDGVVLALAKRYFYVEGVRLLQEDAIAYVKKAAAQAWQYDMVICDLFVDGDVAKGVESSAFLQGLSTLVENGGGVIVNTMLKSDGARAMEGLLKGVFSEVLAWDGMKGNAVFLCKMGGNA